MAGEVEQLSTAIVPSIDLQQWAKDAEVVAGVAVNLAKTSFVPKSFEGRALEATAAILTGVEIGLKPMAALRSIDIIEGVPGMRAILLRALVQSHGHEIWTEETTATRAVVKGRRKGSENVETSTWTMDRATQQGLTGKQNWKRMPQSMLLARATSECARLIDADGLLGIPYSTEELEDLQEGSAGTLGAVPAAPEEKKAPARTAKRQALPGSEERKQAETQKAVEAPKAAFVEPDLGDDWGARGRDFVSEARSAQTRDELQLILEAATEAREPRAVLDEIASFEDSLPGDVDWTAAASSTNPDEVH